VSGRVAGYGGAQAKSRSKRGGGGAGPDALAAGWQEYDRALDRVNQTIERRIGAEREIEALERELIDKSKPPAPGTEEAHFARGAELPAAIERKKAEAKELEASLTNQLKQRKALAERNARLEAEILKNNPTDGRKRIAEARERSKAQDARDRVARARDDDRSAKAIARLTAKNIASDRADSRRFSSSYYARTALARNAQEEGELQARSYELSRAAAKQQELQDAPSLDKNAAKELKHLQESEARRAKEAAALAARISELRSARGSLEGKAKGRAATSAAAERQDVNRTAKHLRDLEGQMRAMGVKGAKDANTLRSLLKDLKKGKKTAAEIAEILSDPTAWAKYQKEAGGGKPAKKPPGNGGPAAGDGPPQEPSAPSGTKPEPEGEAPVPGEPEKKPGEDPGGPSTPPNEPPQVPVDICKLFGCKCEPPCDPPESCTCSPLGGPGSEGGGARVPDGSPGGPGGSDRPYAIGDLLEDLQPKETGERLVEGVLSEPGLVVEPPGAIKNPCSDLEIERIRGLLTSLIEAAQKLESDRARKSARLLSRESASRKRDGKCSSSTSADSWKTVNGLLEDAVSGVLKQAKQRLADFQQDCELALQPKFKALLDRMQGELLVGAALLEVAFAVEAAAWNLDGIVRRSRLVDGPWGSRVPETDVRRESVDCARLMDYARTLEVWLRDSRMLSAYLYDNEGWDQPGVRERALSQVVLPRELEEELGWVPRKYALQVGIIDILEDWWISRDWDRGMTIGNAPNVASGFDVIHATMALLLAAGRGGKGTRKTTGGTRPASPPRRSAGPRVGPVKPVRKRSGPAGTTGPEIPHGFANAGEFEAFGKTLKQSLKDAGFPNAEALFQGSSVTGRGFRPPHAAFDAGRVSDFDIALASEPMLDRAASLGVGLRSGGMRTGPLSAAEVKALGLGDLQRSLEQMAGRPVNFMIYRDAASAAARSPSIGVR
jgi:hypothetical protein